VESIFFSAAHFFTTRGRPFGAPDVLKVKDCGAQSLGRLYYYHEGGRFAAAQEQGRRECGDKLDAPAEHLRVILGRALTGANRRH